MIGRLPMSLDVAGKLLPIRTDFRDVLIILTAFNDPELRNDEKYQVMLSILFEDVELLTSEFVHEAIEKSLWFLDGGRESETNTELKVMDWEQDEQLLFPAVNKIAGREVRTIEYMHWWTFLGYFMEIEDGMFATVLGIRQKNLKGKKLEKWEQEFYRSNKSLCNIKKCYTKEEQEEINYWNELLG